MIVEDHLCLELRRYLTGEMSDQERTAFESRLLDDQEFSDAIAVCEQDIIDAYALGTLAENRTRSIQPWIELAPGRVQRVHTARALLVRRRQKIRLKQRMAVILALAACISIAVGVTLNQTRKSNSKAVRSEKIAATVPSPELAASRAPNLGKPDVILVVAERIRGEQPITTYQIHRDVPVRLQILLMGEAVHTAYATTVIRAEKQRVVFGESGLKAQEKDGQPYLEVSLPAGSLPPATYNIVVTGGGEALSSRFAVRW